MYSTITKPNRSKKLQSFFNSMISLTLVIQLVYCRLFTKMKFNGTLVKENQETDFQKIIAMRINFFVKRNRNT